MSSLGGLMKKLVDTFNVVNYRSDDIDTSFSVVSEGQKIAVLFDGCDISSARKYLLNIRARIIKEHFLNEKAASKVFNLNSFPFNFDKGKFLDVYGNLISNDNVNIRVAKFIIPADENVALNLKCRLALKLEKKVIMELLKQVVKSTMEDRGVNISESLTESMKAEVERCETNCIEYLTQSIKTNNYTKNGYLYSLYFSDPDIQNGFKEIFSLIMEGYGYDDSSLLEVDSDIYIEDIYNNIEFLDNVIKKTIEEIGCHFSTPSNEYGKVERFKNAMSDFIFGSTGVSICYYLRDVFIVNGRVNNGEYYAFVPTIQGSNGQLRYLNSEEVDKINSKFGQVLTDIKGQTKCTQTSIDNIFAFSNKTVAGLLDGIIESSVIRKAEGEFVLEVDLSKFGIEKKQQHLTNPPNNVTTQQVTPLHNQIEQPMEVDFHPDEKSVIENSGDYFNRGGMRRNSGDSWGQAIAEAKVKGITAQEEDDKKNNKISPGGPLRSSGGRPHSRTRSSKPAPYSRPPSRSSPAVPLEEKNLKRAPSNDPNSYMLQDPSPADSSFGSNHESKLKPQCPSGCPNSERRNDTLHNLSSDSSNSPCHNKSGLEDSSNSNSFLNSSSSPDKSGTSKNLSSSGHNTSGTVNSNFNDSTTSDELAFFKSEEVDVPETSLTTPEVKASQGVPSGVNLTKSQAKEASKNKSNASPGTVFVEVVSYFATRVGKVAQKEKVTQVEKNKSRNESRDRDACSIS